MCAQTITDIKKDQASSSWIETLTQVEVTHHPCEHFFIPSAISEDVFSEMRRRLPNSELYYELGGSGTPPRLIFDLLDPEQFSLMNKEDQSFWSRIRDNFFGAEFMRVMGELFRETIRKPLENETDIVERTVKLSRDRCSYSIPVHTDRPHRFISGFFYLPEDNAHPEFGTSLYAPKDKDKVFPDGEDYVREDFEKVKQVPFVRNGYFAFCVTKNSFHGVERLEGLRGYRDMILITMRYKRRNQIDTVNPGCQ